jgi:hypothetical protein
LVGAQINVLKPGGVASAASAGATLTLYPGHGFAVGDKIIIGIDATTFGGAQSVSSVTATTVTMTGGAYAVNTGDTILNLGADTGTSEPLYDVLGTTIYSDPGGINTIANSQLTSSATGEYGYWTLAGKQWELIRTADGAFVDFVVDALAVIDDGVRYVHRFATSGSGTSADPWIGWTLVEGYRNHFRAGYYSAATVSLPITLSNTAGLTSVTGDGSGLVLITITSGTGQFRVYGSGSGTRVLIGVVVNGFTVAPGVNNTSTGLISLENFEMQCIVDDLYVNVGTTYTTSVGMYFRNCSHTTFGTIEVRGYSISGDTNVSCTTGIHFYTDDGAQRGNINLGNVNIVNSITGLKISSSSGSHNNFTFVNLKCVNTVALDTSLAVDLDINCEQITFCNIHMEKFANGMDASSVENIVVVNGLAAQIHNVANNAGTCYKLTNCTGGGQIFSRIDTVYDGILLAGTTSSYFVQAAASGSITGTYFSDTSSGLNVYLIGNVFTGAYTFSGAVTAQAALTVGTTLGVTGASTLTGGVAGGNPYSFGTWPNPTATSGTDTACTNGTIYVGLVFVPKNCTIQGVQFLVGSAGGTDKVIVSLHSTTGSLLANSALAGTTVGTAAQKQRVPFTATYSAVGPVSYYVGLTFNGANAKFRTVPAQCDAGSAAFGYSATQTFGTAASFTAASTFVADTCPVASIY